MTAQATRPVCDGSDDNDDCVDRTMMMCYVMMVHNDYSVSVCVCVRGRGRGRRLLIVAG